jgi:LuxR family maltose regulon positive regulatory protein
MKTSPVTIIQTKLFPPVSLSATVPRERLLRSLLKQGPARLTLLQSSAGFGKSTVLAQWRDRLAGASAWLSLDKDDADPGRLLNYLIAALQATGLINGEEAQRCLDGGGQLRAHDVVGCLINEIVDLDQPLTLFLDDYHLVDCPEVAAVIQDLINFSPANFHLVIASRTMPSLPVASLRASGGITEISEADMRFDQQEATRFFLDLRGLDLSTLEVQELNRKTEGWIAGLQLATLSLQDAEQRQRFIDGFRGDIRAVADYLAAEVLSQQSQEVQNFLLKTAVLERVNAELADRLTGAANGQKLLEQLEESNLFLVPLDDVRRWYRYHHLFRDFLLARLQRDMPHQISQLSLKASQWFLDKGMAEEAINYALESDEAHHAAQLLETHALALIYDGRLPQVDRWLRRVPEEIYSHSYRLRSYHCWALMHMGLWQKTDRILDNTERDLHRQQQSHDPLSERRARLIQAEINVLRLANAVISDDFAGAARLGAEPLPDEQEFSYFAGTQANAMGFLSMSRSELSQALAWGQKALVRHRQSGSVYGQVYAHVLMGLSLLARGALRETLELMEAAERLVINELNHHGFSAAMINVLKGSIYYEWNQLDRARDLVADSLALVEECAALDIRNLAFVTLAGIEQAQGHEQAVHECYERALVSFRERGIDRTRLYLGYQQIKSSLAKAEHGTRDSLLTALESQAAELGIDLTSSEPAPPQWNDGHYYRTLIAARLWLARGNTSQTLMALPALQSLTRKAGREAMALEVGLLLARTLLQAGERQRAFSCALEVLEASRREHYQRLFLDEGDQARSLWLGLQQYLQESSNPAPVSEQVDGILAATRKPQPQYDRAGVIEPSATAIEPSATAIEPSGASRSAEDQEPLADGGDEKPLAGSEQPSAHDLVEPLSPRESSVLSLMSRGQSNKQIASELSLSVNTIRWHVSNILSKLGASNRTEAVTRARELSLS